MSAVIIAFPNAVTDIEFNRSPDNASTVSIDDLIEVVASHSTLPNTDVAASVMGFIEQLQTEVNKGKTVSFDGLEISCASVQNSAVKIQVTKKTAQHINIAPYQTNKEWKATLLQAINLLYLPGIKC